MKRVLLVLLILLSATIFAKEVTTFDFSGDGSAVPSNILKTYIEYSTRHRCYKAIAYFHDIDNDGQNEILGYVQNGLYYSLKGYQLIVLKKEDLENSIQIDNDKWLMQSSNVYFNPYHPVEIKGKQVSYREGDLYKNRQRNASIVGANLDTGFDMEGYTAVRARNLENVLQFSTGNKQNNIDIDEFGAPKLKKYNIHYSEENVKFVRPGK